LAALACGGHSLRGRSRHREDGLARAIASSIDDAQPSASVRDLQPTDVTGLSVYNQQTRDFEFRPGPVFANILLVDQINRAMPKTQATPQAWPAPGDGRRVTRAPDPFLVMATENPIEQEGTFPLPRSQPTASSSRRSWATRASTKRSASCASSAQATRSTT
jgi:MoxR-like ATPase